jgi:hypothetical protein
VITARLVGWSAGRRSACMLLLRNRYSSCFAVSYRCTTLCVLARLDQHAMHAATLFNLFPVSISFRAHGMGGVFVELELR